MRTRFFTTLLLGLSLMAPVLFPSPAQANFEQTYQGLQHDIAEYMRDHNLVSCFVDDVESPERRLIVDEMACVVARSFSLDKNLPRAIAFRRLRREGILDADSSRTDEVTLIQTYATLLKANGFSLPLLVNSEDWPFTDMDPQPVLMKAMELGLFSPESDTRIGFGRNKLSSRSQFIALMYQFELIHAGERSLIEFGTPEVSQTPYSPLGQLDDYELIFNQSLNLIENRSYFRNEFQKRDAIEGALKEIVSSLNDPYSEFLTAEENDRFLQSINGKLEGIGAYVDKRDDQIIIVSPLKGSPAEQAGILPGDVISAVDGESLENVALKDAIVMIKGPAGTQVKLTIMRDGRFLEISVVRAKISIPALTSEERDGYHIMHFTNFSQNSAFEFRKNISQAIENGSSGIVIDLRNNPGGLLYAVQEILDLFIEKGQPLVQIKNLQNTTVDYAREGVSVAGLPVVVLVNKGSASAAEILAGTLQDYGKAVIVGENTFGKGSVQEFYTFGNQQSPSAALKITVALWLTGKGNNIENVGVTPDVMAVDDPETLDEDEAMTKALQILGGGSLRGKRDIHRR